MPASIRFSALGADEYDRNGGYVSFTASTLKAVDRKARHVLYRMGGVKAENAVDAYFEAGATFDAIRHARKAVADRTREKSRELRAAAALLKTGELNRSDVDYDTQLMTKAVEMRYLTKRVTDANGIRRLKHQIDDVVEELIATADRLDEALVAHDKLTDKFERKMTLITANIEYVGLKNDLYHDERYAYDNRSLAQCVNDCSAVISKHAEDAA